MGFSRGAAGVRSVEEEEGGEEEGSNLLFMNMASSNSNNNNNNKVMHHHHHHHHHQSTQMEQHHQQQQQQIQSHHLQHQIQDHHHHHQQIPYEMMQQQPSSSIHGSFLSSSKDGAGSGGGGGGGGGAYDLGELDQALFFYLDGQDPSTVHQSGGGGGGGGMRPPTLNIFPSQPMHAVDPSSTTKGNISSSGLVSSPATSGSKRPSEPSMELANTRNIDHAPPPAPPAPSGPPEQAKAIKREGNRKGPTTSSSEQEGPKTPDPKTLRRLAQNREAARKSRLRKKAYVQQLESSRIKLTQLEQELQRARSQGMFFGGGGINLGGEQGLPINNISADAAVFDMEYARWVEEHHRLMCELRAAVQEHLPENELRMYVDNCLAHYDEMMNLKGMVAKSDVFHLVSGMWKTPAERCFMWMGGFRPSELIKILVSQIEPLTEQQILGICGLQQSTQETEEALSQGLESLNQSLSDTITSDSLSCPPNMANYMGQMAMAMNKLSALEGFVRQADNLRHQTIHRLHQILTTRQAARCLLAIAEYFHRLRALSSLWMARPRQE